MTNYSLVIGNYVITKGEKTVKGKEATPKPEEIEIILPRGLTKGTAVYINPETKSVCNEVDAVSTTGTKTGCMKWYVYKDNGNGTYQVMLDHNTTALVAWNSSGNNIDGMKEVADSLASDTISWNKSLNARLITADEIAEIVGANSEDMIKWNSSKSYGTTIDTQSAWFYFDGGRNSNPKVYESISDGWQKQYAKSIGMSNYAWLFDYTDNCTTLGCNIDDNSNSGYWTSTPVSGNAIDTWTVTRRGRLINNNVGNDYTLGVRPVITI